MSTVPVTDPEGAVTGVIALLAAFFFLVALGVYVVVDCWCECRRIDVWLKKPRL